MKHAVLIPVKDLSRAKTRLAPFLSADERQRLALLMLEGTLGAVAGLDGALRKVVITSYAPAIALARSLNFELIEQTEQVSESHSVDAASAKLEADGVRGVLRVPLDLPLLQRGDLRRILEQADQGKQAVIVPSMHGTGTNGLYRSPPTLFPSYFGEGSLAKHVAAAQERTEHYVVFAMPSMALDIDDKDDLAALLAQEQDCPVREFLHGLEIENRLARANTAAK